MKEGQCRLDFYRLQERDIPEPGDECRWIEVVRKAFGDFVADWSAERFVGRFASSPLFRADGCFFIKNGERYIATAFAWQDEIDTSIGRLHWLAVHPKYQRCGLGRALTLHVLKYHKHHGKTSVSLITELYRDAAIKLYKNVGFTLVDT